MKNKKIINATITESNNIQFKSKLEGAIYNIFLEHGYTLEYEPKKFIVWEGFNPKTPFYSRGGNKAHPTKYLEQKTKKIIGISYTPDFYININDIDIYIEVKGFQNDLYYIKNKLFRKYLDDILEKEGKKSVFFEIYSKTQAIQVINIIKSMYENG